MKLLMIKVHFALLLLIERILKLKLREKIKLFIRDFKLSFKRKKENKFDYIFSLGYNCEAAFRIYRFFKVEESCLFHWTYAYSCKDLISALKNFDLIGKGGFEIPNPLWECKNTHIRFHGKADMSLYVNNKATPDIIEKDKKDLIERIEYLKSKFLKILKGNSKKLYVYNMRTTDISQEDVKELYQTLKNMGGKNFKLLVVTEKSAKFNPEKSDNIIYRTVDFFAPDNDVTSEKYFNSGYDKIFEEFYCTKKASKKKKYKFEKS